MGNCLRSLCGWKLFPTRVQRRTGRATRVVRERSFHDVIIIIVYDRICRSNCLLVLMFGDFYLQFSAVQCQRVISNEIAAQLNTHYSAHQNASPLGPTGAMAPIYGTPELTLHAAKKQKGQANDDRTPRQAGYVMSRQIRIRYRIESNFAGWRTVGGTRKTRFHCLGHVDFQFFLVSTDYNDIRLARLGIFMSELYVWNPEKRSVTQAHEPAKQKIRLKSACKSVSLTEFWSNRSRISHF